MLQRIIKKEFKQSNVNVSKIFIEATIRKAVSLNRNSNVPVSPILDTFCNVFGTLSNTCRTCDNGFLVIQFYF